jgi:hypothetical protein
MQTRFKRFKDAFSDDIQIKLQESFEKKFEDLFARDGTDEKGINVKDNLKLRAAITKIFESYVVLFYEAFTQNKTLSEPAQRNENEYNQWAFKRYTNIVYKQLDAALLINGLAYNTHKKVKSMYGSVIRRTCDTFNEVFPEIKLPHPVIVGSEVNFPEKFFKPPLFRNSFERNGRE